MAPHFSSKIALTLSVAYFIWFVYERFTCISCWGNDIFFSIPFIALVPAPFEGLVVVKYLVVIANAILLWSIIYGAGALFSYIVRIFKK